MGSDTKLIDVFTECCEKAVERQAWTNEKRLGSYFSSLSRDDSGWGHGGNEAGGDKRAHLESFLREVSRKPTPLGLRLLILQKKF